MSRNEDVIELGSSDEELQPASKKQKPRPNAMVHIPHKLPGITIRPAKSNSSKINIPSQQMPSKNTVHRVCNPFAMGVKASGTKSNTKSSLPNIRYVPFPLAKNSPNAKILRKVTMPPGISATVKAIPVKIKSPPNAKEPVIYPRPKQIIYPALTKDPSSVYFNQPIHIKGNLPPTITVKRMKSQQAMPPAKRKKHLLNKPEDVLTVELDDDDANTHNKYTAPSGPQWYMRPEEKKEIKCQEVENNMEPEPSKMIEITIEDSPAKPVNKKACEVGTEYAVTIEDSPVQLPHYKESCSGSEDESEVHENKKDYQSKKKLDYPVSSSSKQTVEVELEPIVAQPSVENKSVTKVILASETIEIEESPIKPPSLEETSEMTTPKKEQDVNPIKPKESLIMKSLNENKIETNESVPIEIEDVEISQFHPTYQSFIDLCFKLENSEDMTKIVEKKIKSYYSQVPKEYTESEEFLDMVSGKIISMRASPEKMYLYIKDVVDELNLQRKMAKAKVEIKDETKVESEKFLYGEESQFDAKRQKQIRKLDKTLKKLHRAIQKLEEQEVDFDDDEDSVYLLTERYKERMVKVHAKFCQLTNTKMPSEPRVYIDARPGQPQGPAKRLEKWINRKVPIGTPLPFPDFHDVLRCVKDANDQDELRWNDVDIMEEARDLFTRCGKKLQRRRQENEWRLAVSRIPADVDPAEESDELKRKLQENRQTATKKEADVFKKFADKQNQLNLEPTEIGDKEADESPADSEEEEPNNEKESLEDKDKRKERIKRLIQEKNQKAHEENGEHNVTDNKPTESVEMETDLPEKESADDTLNNTKDANDAESISTNKCKDSQEGTVKDDGVINSLSDSSQVDSDIDELHLLQKLHSSNEFNDSDIESSNSESPIDISDSLASSSDNETCPKSVDVISIENSSYSETETTQDNMDLDIENKKDSDSQEQETSEIEEKQTNDIKIKESNVGEMVTEKVVRRDVTLQGMEIEFSSLGNARKIITSSNDVCSMTAEEILLASSEDESSKNSPNNECMNVNDDALSIGETCIEFQENEKSMPKDATNSSADESRSKVEITNNIKKNTLENCEENSTEDKALPDQNQTFKTANNSDQCELKITLSKSNIEFECKNDGVTDTTEDNKTQTKKNETCTDSNVFNNDNMKSNKTSKDKTVESSEELDQPLGSINLEATQINSSVPKIPSL